jgi:hypothetical protein
MTDPNAMPHTVVTHDGVAPTVCSCGQPIHPGSQWVDLLPVTTLTEPKIFEQTRDRLWAIREIETTFRTAASEFCVSAIEQAAAEQDLAEVFAVLGISEEEIAEAWRVVGVERDGQ